VVHSTRPRGKAVTLPVALPQGVSQRYGDQDRSKSLHCLRLPSFRME
jgi:hypothetical protein